MGKVQKDMEDESQLTTLEPDQTVLYVLCWQPVGSNKIFNSKPMEYKNAAWMRDDYNRDYGSWLRHWVEVYDSKRHDRLLNTDDTDGATKINEDST